MAARKLFKYAAASSNSMVSSKRNLNLHEHMSIDILREYGIKVPAGRIAHTVSEAVAMSKELPGNDTVVKAQVLLTSESEFHALYTNTDTILSRVWPDT